MYLRRRPCFGLPCAGSAVFPDPPHGAQEAEIRDDTRRPTGWMAAWEGILRAPHHLQPTHRYPNSVKRPSLTVERTQRPMIRGYMTAESRPVRGRGRATETTAGPQTGENAAAGGDDTANSEKNRTVEMGSSTATSSANPSGDCVKPVDRLGMTGEPCAVAIAGSIRRSAFAVRSVSIAADGEAAPTSTCGTDGSIPTMGIFRVRCWATG
jgi:hypothetical protein